MPIEDKLMNKFILGDDYVSELRMKYPWVERAISSGLRLDNKSVFTRTFSVDGQDIVVPTVRRKRNKKGEPLNELEQLSDKKALEMSLKNKDYISAPSPQSAEYISHGLSNWLGNQ